MHEYKCKIFTGCFNITTKTADDCFNEWIAHNKNIEIIEFKYQQSRYGDHSICILYKEKE